MSFWKYLVTNYLWPFLGFMAFVWLFVYVSSFFGPLYGSVPWIALAELVLIAVFIIGNWIAWRKLRP